VPAAPATAQAQAQAPVGQAAGNKELFGVYLAGRQAQQSRDFTAAAGAYEKAIALDPEAPELVARTFLMEVCVGNFDRAKALAPKVLKLDPSDAVAQLVLTLDRRRLEARLPDAEQHTAIRVDGQTGAGRVASAYLGALCDQMPNLGTAEEALGECAFDLVALAFGGEPHRPGPA